MRLLVVNNVTSGPGDDSIHDFIRVAARPGTEILLRTLAPGEPVSDLLGDAEDFDVVVAAGGDGTVSATLYELRDSGVVVLPFPSGTANILALNLDLPTTATGLAELVYSGVPARFDLGEFEGHDENGGIIKRGFSIVAGAGYDATVVKAADAMKGSLGVGAYIAGALANLAPTHAHISLEIDGETIETEGISVFMLNFGKYQFDLKITPDFDPQDGQFDIGVANTKMVLGLLPIIASMGLDPDGTRTDALEIYKGSEVKVVCDPPLPIEFDGEPETFLTPMTARILKGAASILVPADSLYAPRLSDA